MNLEELLKTKQEQPGLPDAANGFVIYGAGSAGKDVYRILQKKKLAVRFFIDRNAEKFGSIEGIKVITPDKAAGADKTGVCAVVGLFNGFVNSADICDELKAIGFNPVINFYELYHIMPEEFGGRYFMAPKEFLAKNSMKLLETAGIWADTRSRELYEQALAFRYTGNMKYSPVPEKKGFSYFPADIPGWKHPERFIDCGAYVGDTLVDIKKHKGRIKNVIAFEPDPDNFRKLSETVRTGNVAAEAALYPCAVFSSTGRISFSAKQDRSGLINTGGERFIQAASLDEVLPMYRPDMIKMDIEGAEPEALKGAQKMITKYRPNLAVCMYHTPGHIWEIPQLIKNWNLGYRLYLRSYNYHSFDIVMHAVKN